MRKLLIVTILCFVAMPCMAQAPRKTKLIIRSKDQSLYYHPRGYSSRTRRHQDPERLIRNYVRMSAQMQKDLTTTDPIVYRLRSGDVVRRSMWTGEMYIDYTPTIGLLGMESHYRAMLKE